MSRPTDIQPERNVMETHQENSPNAPKPRALAGLLKGALLGGVVTAGFLLVVGVLVFRESVPPLTEADFIAATERWDKAGPKDYDCDIEIFGNRSGNVHVEVRNGAVSRMSRDGEVPRDRRTWDAWSVEGMFDTIERELEIANNPEVTVGGTSRPILNARFETRWGYPEVYRRSVPGSNQDVAWKITRFEAISPDSP